MCAGGRGRAGDGATRGWPRRRGRKRRGSGGPKGARSSAGYAPRATEKAGAEREHGAARRARCRHVRRPARANVRDEEYAAAPMRLRHASEGMIGRAKGNTQRRGECGARRTEGGGAGGGGMRAVTACVMSQHARSAHATCRAAQRAGCGEGWGKGAFLTFEGMVWKRGVRKQP